MNYPEHEKLDKVKDQSQTIGEFLDWLDAVKLYRIAKYHRHTEACRDPEHRTLECGYSIDELEPVRDGTLSLLADYSGIDLDKLEAEKDLMLSEIRRLSGDGGTE
jgi:hypothetical protein